MNRPTKRLPPLGGPAIAMAVVMACSSTLPAMASLRQPSPGVITTEVLLAKERDKDKDDKEERRKKNKKKQSEQRHSEQRRKETRKQEIQRNDRKSNNKKSNNKTTPERTLTKEERDRIYRKGVRDGKERGYDRGVRSGYREGLDKGRDREYNRGYNRGYDRGYRKASDRWKDWDSNRWRTYNNRRRDIWRRPVVVNNYYGNPGWARSRTWYRDRPWGGGWYGGWGSSSPPWGWWFGQSLVWGITTIATAAIINNAIERAIERRQPTVLVPDTNWQLYYGSVQPVQESGVTFAVYNGAGTYQMEADCNEGLLNGEVPTTPAEAQLINAACQVTYGTQI
ncbi:hypothetical protein [Cyanobium sp. NIES-981]|uniref:hypothetical protein n=1 Tax=Cyanobium sp. NIES-981 TaxID=1851505 RepID=UPI0007DCCDA8|nr:hypothetical protein [Cyanobium sp. NIES-981]SBO43043.1 conserved exported protein of unknown function [Cyanobium sp. NIES-981]